MDIVTKHFDIFDDIVILDLPIENTLQILYYKRHKLIQKEEWSFASVRDTGESIRGTRLS